MPSTVVHLALAGLIAAALLGEHFDRRALLVVAAVTALPDLDSFVALVSPVGHRAALHTFVIPIAGAVLLFADLRLRSHPAVRAWLRRVAASERVRALSRRASEYPVVGRVPLGLREESLVRRRWGARGVRLAWVCLVCYAFAGIALDLADGVVNPLWPLHDQYYHLDGKVELSSRRGIVQTFVDLGGASGEAGTSSVGTTDDVVLDTGVNPQQAEDEPVDRVFPVVRAGWELVLLVAGTVVTAVRVRLEGRAAADEGA